MFASNGFDVVVPCLPTPIAELKKSVDIFKDNIKEGLELCHDILEMTPNSALKSAFKSIQFSLLTAKTLCQGTVLTTGAAYLIGIASQPVIMPVGHHQGMHLFQPPSGPATEPETQTETSQKRQHEGDGDYISPTKRRVFTPLKQFECHCGLELLNHDVLEVHTKGTMPIRCGSVVLPNVKKFTTHQHLLGYTSEINIPRSSGTTAMLENVNMDMMK